jgi:putative transcriptional regulator
MSIGERLRILRLQKSLSQAQLAGRIGVDRKTINRIENNVYSPNIKLFCLILKSLESSPKKFFRDGLDYSN